MTYFDIITKINTLKPTTDVMELVRAINKLKDYDEHFSAMDALFRAADKMSDYQRECVARQYHPEVH